MSPVDTRKAFNELLDAWRLAIPGTEPARVAAQAVVASLLQAPYLNDQIRHTTAAMVSREAMGLSPVPHD